MPQTQIKRTQPEKEDALCIERRAFERQLSHLLRRYSGQFVAFYGGRLVDRDKDPEALAARLFVELGDVSFFIARVEKRPSVYDLPSPDFER
jgi:hypothetical protein